MTTEITTATLTEEKKAPEQEVVEAATAFERTTNAERLAELKQAFEDKVAALGGALAEGDFQQIDAAQKNADEAAEEYNGYKTRYEWENFFESDNPAFEALKVGYIDLARKPKPQKQGGVVVAVPQYAPVQIDFLAFAGASRYRIFGAKLVQRAHQACYLTALLEGSTIGKSVADINKAFDASPKRVIVSRFEEVPTKSQLKAAIQDLFDDLLFIPNEKGENRYMVTSQLCKMFRKLVTTARYGKGFLDDIVATAAKTVQISAGIYHSMINEYGITIKVDDQKC